MVTAALEACSSERLHLVTAATQMLAVGKVTAAQMLAVRKVTAAQMLAVGKGELSGYPLL